MSGAGFPYRWDPDYQPRVGLLERDGSADDVSWFDVEPCYVFHPMNAYDDDGTVVLDVVRHPRMFDTHRLGPDEGTPTLDRWTLDLAAGKVVEERLDDRGQEFPRVDERLVGRPARFGYAVHTRPGRDGFAMEAALVKYDLATGTTEEHRFGPGRTPGEGVLVPASADAGEDDGYVLAYVHDAGSDSSQLVILDASDFAASPVATVTLPQRVPFGFHGSWVADTELRR